MAEVGVHEAKTNLSKLLKRVESGETIVIHRSGKPVAKLVAAEAPVARVLGQDAGLYTVPADFNAPLPEDLQDLFER